MTSDLTNNSGAINLYFLTGYRQISRTSISATTLFFYVSDLYRNLKTSLYKN